MIFEAVVLKGEEEKNQGERCLPCYDFLIQGRKVAGCLPAGDDSHLSGKFLHYLELRYLG